MHALGSFEHEAIIITRRRDIPMVILIHSILGKIRKQVLLNLEKPMTPTQLSEKIKTHRSTVSRAIIALEEKNLLECITPNENMGRYYQISDLGKKILNIL